MINEIGILFIKRKYLSNALFFQCIFFFILLKVYKYCSTFHESVGQVEMNNVLSIHTLQTGRKYRNVIIIYSLPVTQNQLRVKNDWNCNLPTAGLYKFCVDSLSVCLGLLI